MASPRPLAHFPDTPAHRAPPGTTWLRALACAALCLLLGACGFHLRGPSPLPFNTLYTNVAENTDFGANLRRAIVASSPNTHFVDDAKAAQAQLIQLGLNQSLRELSINTAGQVDEYELNLDFSFQLTDAKGHLLLPPTNIHSSVDLPYDPNQVQAGAGEIDAQFKSMRQSLIDRIVRRLTSPEVVKAYENADFLPVESSHPNTAPLQPGAGEKAPTPWSGSNAAGSTAF